MHWLSPWVTLFFIALLEIVELVMWLSSGLVEKSENAFWLERTEGMRILKFEVGFINKQEQELDIPWNSAVGLPKPPQTLRFRVQPHCFARCSTNDLANIVLSPPLNFGAKQMLVRGVREVVTGYHWIGCSSRLEPGHSGNLTCGQPSPALIRRVPNASETGSMASTVAWLRIRQVPAQSADYKRMGTLVGDKQQDFWVSWLLLFLLSRSRGRGRLLRTE